MRIMVVMPVASPWAREAARHLAAAGQEVHCVSFATGRGTQYLAATDEFQRAEIERLRASVAGMHTLATTTSSYARYLAGVRGLRAVAARVRPDVLLTLYGGGPAAMAWASRIRPYVVYLVGSDVLLMSSWRARLSRLSLRGAAAVLANGEFLAARGATLSGRDDVQPLYLGVDVERFHPNDARTPEPLRIVCTRGFAPVYANETIVRALATMRTRAQATFVAGGPGLQDAIALADATLAGGARERVRFLGGVGNDEVARLLPDAHVYVSMSRSDGTSTSLMEALACGVFPVVSDIPPNREWIDERAGNGILVPLDRPDLLAAALDRAVEDTALRARAAAHNLRLVRERADARVCAERLIDALGRVVRH